MSERCTGCGRAGDDVQIFRCSWPDGRSSRERHCPDCRLSWHPQLRSLGTKIDRIEADGSPVQPALRAI